MSSPQARAAQYGSTSVSRLWRLVGEYISRLRQVFIWLFNALLERFPSQGFDARPAGSAEWWKIPAPGCKAEQTLLSCQKLGEGLWPSRVSRRGQVGRLTRPHLHTSTCSNHLWSLDVVSRHLRSGTDSSLPQSDSGSANLQVHQIRGRGRTHRPGKERSGAAP